MEPLRSTTKRKRATDQIEAENKWKKVKVTRKRAFALNESLSDAGSFFGEHIGSIQNEHITQEEDCGLLIGINPSLFAAYKGHHYAGPGNHFWKCLYLSGLTQEQMSAEEDYKLLKYGIGFTNMVQRATKGSADLTRKEIKDGSRLLLEKLQRFRPKIAVFNGKLIFEVFSGKKDFNFGRQQEYVEGTDTYVWVMPSSSARCAQLPRAADKVPFYMALKTFRDYLNGFITHIEESELVFTEHKIKQTYIKKNISDHRNEGSIKSARTELCASTITHEITTPVSGIGIDYNKTKIQSIGNDAQTCIGQNNERIVDNCETTPNISRGNGIQDNYSRFLGRSTQVSCIYKPDPELPDISVSTQQPENCKFIMSPYHNPPPPQKKKRGRPKKIKAEDILAPAICIPLQLMSETPSKNSFVNKLSLSMLNGGPSSGLENTIAPKKKRGRPKKVKPFTESQQSQNSLAQPAPPQLMAIKCLPDTDINSEQYIKNFQKQALAIYTSKNLNQDSPKVYSTCLPMQSPLLNCSYAGITPPTSTQSTPPTHRQQNDNPTHDNGIMAGVTDIFTASARKNDNGYVQSNATSSYYESQNISRVFSNFLDLPESLKVPSLRPNSPPSSPNMCAGEFGPSGDIGAQNQHQPALKEKHQELQQDISHTHPLVENLANPQSTTVQFQKWVSPNSDSFLYAYDTQRAQEKQERQQNQQKSKHALHHFPLNEATAFASIHIGCQRQQGFEGVVSNSYGLSPIPTYIHQINHIHQQKHHLPPIKNQHYGHSQNQASYLINNETNKSLSGLESLVEQIPSTSYREFMHITKGKTSINPAVGMHSQSFQEQNALHLSQGVQHQQKDLKDNHSTPDMSSGNYCSENCVVSCSSAKLYVNETLNCNDISCNVVSYPPPALFSSHSLGNFSTQSHNTSPPSSVIMSLQNNQKQQKNEITLQERYESPVSTSLMNGVSLTSTPLNSPSKYADQPTHSSHMLDDASHACTTAITSPVSASTSPLNRLNRSITANMYCISNYNNFSLTKLATPSPTLSNSDNITSDYPSLSNVSSVTATSNIYHQSNFMAALAAAASSSASNQPQVSSNTEVAHHAAHHVPCSEMYMEPRRHLPSHVGSVDPLYTTTHPHLTTHHLHSAYATAPTQHTTTNDYSNPYGTPLFSATTQVNPSHMQGTNYPYGYTSQEAAVAAVAHSGYPSSVHEVPHPQSSQTNPLSLQPAAESSVSASIVSASSAVAPVYHTHYSGHSSLTNLHQYSQSMFDPFKPSDITSYGGF